MIQIYGQRITKAIQKIENKIDDYRNFSLYLNYPHAILNKKFW